MAGPGAIAEVGMGSTALGGATGALGSIMQGQSQQRMYDYQAQVALINAQTAKQNSEYSFQVGEQQAQSYGTQAAQELGHIKAAESSSGFDVNSGSSAKVIASQKYTTSLNLDQIRSNAAKTAYNYDVQATGFENQATLYKSAGVNAMNAGYIGATSSILGASASVSSQWLQGNQAGLFNSGSSTINPGSGVGIGMA